MLEVGLGVVRSTPDAASQFGVAAMLLSQIKFEIDEAADASMPPRLFATKYWSQWFDQFGNIAFRRT